MMQTKDKFCGLEVFKLVINEIPPKLANRVTLKE
eukprot:11858.XXX_10788_10889_1 [CDS] Oithona nana genome sequencing.